MAWFKPKRTYSKLFVLGLDGTPATLLRALLSQARLSSLRRLLRAGSFRPLHSVLPPVSSVAWASFMTGRQPANHGVFGFVDRRPATLETYLPNFRSLKAPTLWRTLSDLGKRVIVMNVPTTYPPETVNGLLVCGFDAPSLEKATSPPEFASRLANLGYQIDVDPWLARESKRKFLDELLTTMRNRFEVASLLATEEVWDFFMLHVMDTDRLHHFFWEAWDTQDPEGAPQFVRFYEELDALIGQLVERLPRNCGLVILSDHGFCTLYREFYLNHWLQEHGWLALTEGEAEELTAMRPESRAYSLIPGRVYVNVRGRERSGCVPPGEEYRRVRDELATALRGIRDPETNREVVQAVFTREEAFRGTCFDEAPDLMVLPVDGYDLKGNLRKGTLMDKGDLSGMHTFDNAMLYIRGERLDERSASIVDVTATVLDMMGLPQAMATDGMSLRR